MRAASHSRLLLSSGQPIGLLRRLYIRFHPTCAKNTNQASNNQCWRACNQQGVAEVLTRHTLHKVLPMRWIKSLSQHTHDCRSQSITQQMRDEQRDSYTGGTQGCGHNILGRGGTWPLVNSDQQGSDNEEDDEKGKAVQDKCECKSRRTE